MEEKSGISFGQRFDGQVFELPEDERTRFHPMLICIGSVRK